MSIDHIIVSENERRIKYKSGRTKKIDVDTFRRLVEEGYNIKVVDPLKIVRVDVKVENGRTIHFAVMSDGSNKRVSKAIFDIYAPPFLRRPKPNKEKKVTWGKNDVKKISPRKIQKS